jgi:hypothetical protein
MIPELTDAINVADATNNKVSKEVLLKIAGLKEENQKLMLDFVFAFVKAGESND